MNTSSSQTLPKEVEQEGVLICSFYETSPYSRAVGAPTVAPDKHIGNCRPEPLMTMNQLEARDHPLGPPVPWVGAGLTVSPVLFPRGPGLQLLHGAHEENEPELPPRRRHGHPFCQHEVTDPGTILSCLITHLTPTQPNGPQVILIATPSLAQPSSSVLPELNAVQLSPAQLSELSSKLHSTAL